MIRFIWFERLGTDTDQTAVRVEFPANGIPAQLVSNIGLIDDALKKINKQRADLGAYQNRLEHTIRGTDVAVENMQASESRIRDLDMADETVKLTKHQILSQSSTAMLAQANQQSQMVLQLLQ